MDSEKTYLDIDELAKKIEERIKELEKKDREVKEETTYTNKETEKNISDLDEIIREIDEKIREIEASEIKEEPPKVTKEVNIDVEALMDKVNKKLETLDDVEDEDLGKTLYDLSAISDAINETIRNLEANKKKKKEKKAKYCEQARMKNKKCDKK